MNRVSACMARLFGWRRRRDERVCAATHDRIQELVDGEMAPARATRVMRRHLAACRRCGAEAEMLVELKSAIARVTYASTDELARKLEVVAHGIADGAGPSR